MNPLKIGNSREVFWDDYLINTSRTGAYLKQHQPQRQDIGYRFDHPWEKGGASYKSITFENGMYRMYYNINNRMCCIESQDGIRWEAPELDIVPYPGCEKTNILLGTEEKHYTSVYVFLDTKPGCPYEERYKLTVLYNHVRTLLCYTSADGYHFKFGWVMSDVGSFDTMNVAFWSEKLNKYVCYIRDYHDLKKNFVEGDGENWNVGVRDVRLMVSDDFKNWTDPVLLDFGNAEDIPLYTNMVFPYYRSPQIMVGMPTRYYERQAWTGNYDQLVGKEARLERMKQDPRYGLTVTDCVVMTSRDGLHWNRQDEAFITPGIERDRMWVYGDCFPNNGFIETPSTLKGAPNEMSCFVHEGHWSEKPAFLWRYTSRIDGLFSYRADYAPKTLVTKPILYEGGQLSLNFSTSALGYIYVTMSDGKNKVTSCELFGDTLDRKVPFDGDLSKFVGKEVTLEFVMSDADLYSMQFQNIN